MTLSSSPNASDPLQLVAAVEQACTAAELLRATQVLAATCGAEAPPQVIGCLVEILGFNNPGAAVAAVDGLIAIGTAAVPALLDGLDEHNYGARAWAVRALAGIGDVRGLDLLEQALGNDIGPSVRRAAARGLGGLRLAELAEGERAAVRERCLGALETARADGEWVVRYAVAVACEGLALPLGAGDGQQQRARASLSVLAGPQEEAAVVRLRAELALRRLEG